MVKVLEQGNVEFNPNATVFQLRKLYDELISTLLSTVSVATTATTTTKNAVDDKKFSISTTDTSAFNSNTIISSDVISTAMTTQTTTTAAIITSILSTVPSVMAEINKVTIDELLINLLRTPSTNSIEHIKSMIAPFNIDNTTCDIYTWMMNLEHAFNLLKFDNRERLMGLCNMLNGTAKDFAQTVTAMSYGHLRRALLNKFGEKRSMIEGYRQLHSRRLRPAESIYHYILQMQDIASHLKMSELELIEIILAGIGNISPDIIMLYGATTLNDLKTLALRYERLQSHTNLNTTYKPYPRGRPTPPSTVTAVQQSTYTDSGSTSQHKQLRTTTTTSSNMGIRQPNSYGNNNINGA